MTAPKEKIPVQRQSPPAALVQPAGFTPLCRRDALDTFQTEQRAAAGQKPETPPPAEGQPPAKPKPSIPFTLRKQEDASTTAPAAGCGPVRGRNRGASSSHPPLYSSVRRV
jgi:hypothetical protein